MSPCDAFLVLAKLTLQPSVLFFLVTLDRLRGFNSFTAGCQPILPACRTSFCALQELSGCVCARPMPTVFTQLPLALQNSLVTNLGP